MVGLTSSTSKTLVVVASFVRRSFAFTYRVTGPSVKSEAGLNVQFGSTKLVAAEKSMLLVENGSCGQGITDAVDGAFNSTIAAAGASCPGGQYDLFPLSPN